jgi:DNA-binding XRE family transcriptional regulator
MQTAETKEEVTPRCMQCGGSNVTVRPFEKKYHYLESGLRNVWLHGGVIETSCADCRHRSVAIKKEPQLLQVIAMGLLMRTGSLRGPELKYLRQACELTQETLAERLDVRRPTISEWEAGDLEKVEKARMLHLRMVLLREFRGFVGDASNCHLSNAQVREVDSFARAFTTEFEQYFRPARKVSVTVRNTNDEWEPCLDAA